MPSRKLAFTGSLKRDRKGEPREQSAFYGVFEDPPATDIPNGTLSKAINCHAMGKSVAPRLGSSLYGDPWPAIPGRTGYSAHKVDKHIISDSGDIFTEDDVGNDWMWDNALSDKLCEFISATEMRVRDDDANTGTACYIKGKTNLWFWHPTLEKWVIQLGEQFWIADREMTTYTLVVIFSKVKPNNCESQAVLDNDNVLVQNSAGKFRILLDRTPPLAYQTNSPVPQDLLSSNESDGEKACKYHYMYALALLDGSSSFRDRETRGTKILTESGVNIANADRKDWAVINTDDPVDTGEDTYGQLDGGSGINSTVHNVWDIIQDGTARFNINGYGYRQIIFDFHNCITMFDIAQVIQDALQQYFPSATCEYVADEGDPRIRITSGFGAIGTMEYALAGTSGTDVATTLKLTVSAGAVLSTPATGNPNIVRSLKIPTGEQHWSHFPIYRTGDLGPDGSRLKKGKSVVNSQDGYIWDKDLRCCASFIARRNNGCIEIKQGYGEFEPADVGSVVEFEDRTRLEILEYINSMKVRYSDNRYYVDATTSYMGACIGNGRVMRCSQSGTVVTRTAGTTFSDSDVEKPIQWPNGNRSYIRQVFDADNAVVWNSMTQSESAFTIDPVSRNFCDILSDEKLFMHSSGWKCKGRFLREEEPANLIISQPGFLMSAARGSMEIRYCQLESGSRQYIGYHSRTYQKIMLDDKIVLLLGFPDRFAAMCMGSSYSGNTASAGAMTVPETEQMIAVLGGMNRLGIGIDNPGSVKQISAESVRVVTNENEIRDFNGLEFSDNILVNTETNQTTMKNALGDALRQFAAIASHVNGYIIWWKKKNA